MISGFEASDNFSKYVRGKVSVMVDNKDPGASVNIIDRSTYDILCQSGKYSLFESKTRIIAYGSD